MRNFLSAFLLIGGLGLYENASAVGVDVSGTISENTNWSGVVNVVGDLVVAKGANIFAQNGTTVIFQGHYTITVYGGMLCRADIGDDILFTAKNPDVGWGGIQLYNDSNPVDSTLFLRCLFEYARMPGSGDSALGGAIYAGPHSRLHIANSIFQNNSAGAGGAVYLKNSNITMENCIFRNNQATGGGGGIFLDSSDAVIVGCLFDGNLAKTGGAMELSGSSPHFTNLLLTRNTAEVGSGFQCVASSPVVVNSIVWNNVKTAGSGQIDLQDDSSDPTFTQNLLQGGIGAFTGAGAGAKYTGAHTGEIDIDPQFQNPDAGDFTLKMTSPAVGAGTDFINGHTLFIPSFDLSNKLRFGYILSGNNGNRIDLGPYEWQGYPTTGIRARVNANGEQGNRRSSIRINFLGRQMNPAITSHATGLRAGTYLLP